MNKLKTDLIGFLDQYLHDGFQKAIFNTFNQVINQDGQISDNQMNKSSKNKKNKLNQLSLSKLL